MGLAVSLSGFACYHQVAPTGLDEDGRSREECEIGTYLVLLQQKHLQDSLNVVKGIMCGSFVAGWVG